MSRSNLKLGIVLACLVAFAAELSTTPICFHDVAANAGLAFVLDNGATAQKHMIETMAGGLAIFDYNNDGRPDIYFTNGAEVHSLEKTSSKYSNRLFRNDGGLKFTDVTDTAGLAGEGYSMGAAAGDFDLARG